MGEHSPRRFSALLIKVRVCCGRCAQYGVRWAIGTVSYGQAERNRALLAGAALVRASGWPIGAGIAAN
jgi:hypothetical protein